MIHLLICVLVLAGKRNINCVLKLILVLFLNINLHSYPKIHFACLLYCSFSGASKFFLVTHASKSKTNECFLNKVAAYKPPSFGTSSEGWLSWCILLNLAVVATSFLKYIYAALRFIGSLENKIGFCNEYVDIEQTLRTLIHL